MYGIPTNTTHKLSVLTFRVLATRPNAPRMSTVGGLGVAGPHDALRQMARTRHCCTYLSPLVWHHGACPPWVRPWAAPSLPRDCTSASHVTSILPELFARLNIMASFLCYKAGCRGPLGLAELCAARLLEITFAGFVFALTFSCDWASII